MRRLADHLSEAERRLYAAGGRAAPRYVRILIVARKSLGLSTHEYVLGAAIDALSRRTGWCYASRRYLAEVVGVSRRTVHRLLRKLRSAELVETHPQRAHLLRPSARWRRSIHLANEAEAMRRRVSSRPSTRDETSRDDATY